MTWYPSSELLLDPSPLRVSDTVPGQLARSTARGLAAQRRIAPRPFATRGGGFSRAGIALEIANAAWNLLLSQDIPLPGAEYPVGAPAGSTYRLRASVTWKDRRPPPWDLIDVSIIDTILPGPIFSVGDFTQVVTFAGGFAETFRGVGANLLDSGGAPALLLFGQRNIAFWELLSVNSLVLTLVDSPLVPIPSTLSPPPSSQPGDSPGLDIDININLPGGIPGLLMPIIIPIIIPRPGSLGDRPIPIIYPPTIPLDIRRSLPQGWLTPEGIQIGTGSSDDRITVTVGDTITNVTNLTQVQDFRVRNPPPVTTCTPDPEPPGEDCTCEEIRAIVVEELDSKFPPSRPNSLTVSIQPVGESNTFVLPRFTQWIELRIVQPPPNVRMQTGGALAPEVVYNGWYSFGATGEASERIPFHYNFISIRIPEGISEFSYTVYSGGTAQATIGYLLEG